jgi:MoaA/NifB/PqqE/SkfB family radical SAM enzyme
VPFSPRYLSSVFLHVTRRCNARCVYCYLPADRPSEEEEELSLGDWVSVWPSLLALSPQRIVFTGGEPLLRPDILKLIDTLAEADGDHGVSRCLNTNGRGVTRDLARALIGRADEVRVSIDAMPARNDALRGPGAYAAAVNALGHLQRAGFEPIALVTVTKPSLPDLTELMLSLKGMGVSRVRLNPLKPIGRAVEWQHGCVLADDIDRASLEAWLREDRGRVAPESPSRLEQIRLCGLGQSINILPGGGVTLCHVLSDPAYWLGDVRNGSVLARLMDPAVRARLSCFAIDNADADGASPWPGSRGCLGPQLKGTSFHSRLVSLLRDL